MFRSILIPTDFSPAAWKAFRVGLQLGKLYNAEITLLHVYPVIPGVKTNSDELHKKLNSLRQNMEKISKQMIDDENQIISSTVIAGMVKEQLTDFVNRHKYDLVIMGVNGNGADNAPGSHTTDLLSCTNKPVLVIPNTFDIHE